MLHRQYGSVYRGQVAAVAVDCEAICQQSLWHSAALATVATAAAAAAAVYDSEFSVSAVTAGHSCTIMDIQ